jgi:hypothetical protein
MPIYADNVPLLAYYLRYDLGSETSAAPDIKAAHPLPYPCVCKRATRQRLEKR